MESTNLSQNVDTLFSNLEKFTQNEGLIGKAMTHDNKTFIPVVSVTMGYGTGNSATKAQSNSITGSGKMAGGALGLGAKLSTDAVIVIDKDQVSMLPVNSTGSNTSQLIDKIPQMVSSIGQNQQQNQQQSQQQSQGQGQGNQAQVKGNQNKQQ